MLKKLSVSTHRRKYKVNDLDGEDDLLGKSIQLPCTLFYHIDTTGTIICELKIVTVVSISILTTWTNGTRLGGLNEN